MGPIINIIYFIWRQAKQHRQLLIVSLLLRMEIIFLQTINSNIKKAEI